MTASIDPALHQLYRPEMRQERAHTIINLSKTDAPTGYAPPDEMLRVLNDFATGLVSAEAMVKALEELYGLSPQDQHFREKAAAESLANVWLSGLEIDPYELLLKERYIAGNLTSSECIALIKQRYHTELAPSAESGM